VVLIDEYDKPLTDTLTDPDLNQRISTALCAFYRILKSADHYLRFLFMTGVTRFSELGRYSGLNQVWDISMGKDYAGICGMTANELQAYFQPELKALAARCRMSDEEVWARMKQEYDGYHFCKGSEGVFNPYCVLNTFADQRFTHEWSRTGSPKLRGKQFANKKPSRKKKSEQEAEGEIPALTTRQVAAAAREALAQIDDKGYLLPYSASGARGASGKKLVKVGAVFDAKTRTLGGWKVAEPAEQPAYNG
jgi:hypothetical protein